MKTHYLFAALAMTATSAFAQFTLSGTALLKTPGNTVGDFGVVLVDVNGVGFTNVTFDLAAGEALAQGSSYGDFVVIVAPKAFQGNASTWAFNASASGVPFDNGIGTGDRFAVVTFENSSTEALVGDTYRVWTDPTWVVPSAGGGLTFSTSGNVGTIQQLGTSATPTLTGVVSAIPEPSSFAAVAGLGILGFAAMRKRRRA